MIRRTHSNRAQRKTLLAVGEGDAEVAFLKYLRGIYCADGLGVSVTVRNAHGKGPGNVISTAIGLLRNSSYDRMVCLLDTDLVWTEKNKKEASRHKIELIGSTPCLEGLLLQILGKPVPLHSASCKLQLKAVTGRDMFEVEDYEGLFKKVVLQAMRGKIMVLDQLLKRYEGQ